MAEFPDKRGVSRRKFLKVAAGGIAGAAILTSGAVELRSLLTGSSASQELLKNLTRPAFSQHLGEQFRIRKGALEEVSVKLVEVSEISTTPVTAAGESFSAVFEGDPNHPLGQDTYILEHPAMGTFPLLIVPIYYQADGLHYEAIFNRLRM